MGLRLNLPNPWVMVSWSGSKNWIWVKEDPVQLAHGINGFGFANTHYHKTFILLT
jgi:hypothetical protein